MTDITSPIPEQVTTTPAPAPVTTEQDKYQILENTLKKQQEEIALLKQELSKTKQGEPIITPEEQAKIDQLILDSQKVALEKQQSQINGNTNQDDDFYSSLPFEEKTTLGLDIYDSILNTYPFIDHDQTPDIEFQKIMNDKGYLDEGAKLKSNLNKAVHKLAKDSPHLVVNGKLNAEGSLRISKQFEKQQAEWSNKILDSYEKMVKLRKRNIKKITVNDF
jgi:hypothetical protein